MENISKQFDCMDFVGQHFGSSILTLVFSSLTHAAVLIILFWIVLKLALTNSVSFKTSFCKVCSNTYAIECKNRRNWLALKLLHEERSDLRYNLCSFIL